MSEERMWKTKEGKTLHLKDMKTSHIENSLAMLKRNGFVAPSTVEFYLCCAGPSGDMAQMMFEQELDNICRAPISPFIDWFEEELEIRRLNAEIKETP